MDGAFSAPLSADGDPAATPRPSAQPYPLAELSEKRICLQLVAAASPLGFTEVRAKFPQLVASLARRYYHFHFQVQPCDVTVVRSFSVSRVILPIGDLWRRRAGISCCLVLLDNPGSLVFHHL